MLQWSTFWFFNAFCQKSNFGSLKLFFPNSLSQKEFFFLFPFFSCLGPITLSKIILHTFGWEWNFNFLISCSELCCSDFISVISGIWWVKNICVSVGCTAPDSHFVAPQLDYCLFMFAAFLGHALCKSLVCTKFST